MLNLMPAFTEEQSMLRDSVARFARERGGLDNRRQSSAEPHGFSAEGWQQFAENGWLAAIFPEALGGIGGGAEEMAIIMEVIGRGLLTEPYLASVVLGGKLVERLGSPAQANALLAPMIDGRTRLALAFVEPRSGYDLFRIDTTLKRSGSKRVLDGVKIAVLNGDTADTLLVTARTEEGPVVVIVPRDAAGVRIDGCATVDGLRGANIALSSVHIPDSHILGDPTRAIDALEYTIDLATAAVCAEAVGAMSELLTITTEYLKTRRQFGRALSDNQALQHRAVDMYVALHETRVLVVDAIRGFDERLVGDRKAAVSAAKAHTGAAARLIGQEAVQLHGAIGTTEDCIVGHYFKRLTAIDLLFGNRTWQLRRFSKARLQQGPGR